MSIFDPTPLDLRLISIYIDNGLNQNVTVQIKANREKAHAKAVTVGQSFIVAANSQVAKSMSIQTSGWLPYIMVEVFCNVVPTAGNLTIYRLKTKNEVKLVDALGIRDGILHTSLTDSTKVLIQDW